MDNHNKLAMRAIEIANGKLARSNNTDEDLALHQKEIDAIIGEYGYKQEIIKTYSNGISKIRISDANNQIIAEYHHAPPCNDVGIPLIINGAWYVDQFPTMIVMEKVDGTLGMFYLTPFRAIKEVDIKPYNGYHPRKMKGNPLPDYLYRFYGLERNDESLSEVIRVRVSPTEKGKLEAASKNSDKTVSEFLRDHIRSL